MLAGLAFVIVVAVLGWAPSGRQPGAGEWVIQIAALLVGAALIVAGRVRRRG